MRKIICHRFYKGVVIFFMVWQMSLSVNGSSILTTYSFSKHRQGKKLDQMAPIKIVEDIESSIRCVGLCMRYGRRIGDEKKMKCTAVNFSTKKKICELLPERICDNNKYVLKDDEFFSYFDVEMDRNQISFLDSASCQLHGKCSGQCDKFDTTSTSVIAETSTLSTLSTATSISTTSATTSAATSTTTSTTPSTSPSTPTSTTTSTTVTPSSSSTTTTEITTTPTESTSQTTTTSSATTTVGTIHESTTTTSTSTEPITTSTEISSTTELSSLESTSLSATMSTTPEETTELSTSTTTSPLTTATSPPTSSTTITSTSTTITSTSPKPECKGYYIMPPINKCIFIISKAEECKDKEATGLHAETVDDLNQVISILSSMVETTEKPNIQIFIPIVKWNEGWFLNDISSDSLPWVSTDKKEGYDCCIMNGGNDFRLVPIPCREGGQYSKLCEIQYGL